MIKANILTALKVELNTLRSAEGKRLSEIHLILNEAAEVVTKYDGDWAGAWGQDDFDHYNYSKQVNSVVKVKADYFYNKVKSELNIDIQQLGKEVFKLLNHIKPLGQNVATELSVVTGTIGFEDELELLKKIEDYEWGFDINTVIKHMRPTTFVIRGYRNINRDLETPPHLYVAADIAAITTQAFSAAGFFDLISRLIRQIEIKLEKQLNQETPREAEAILKNIFDNFHNFCNQLKVRHNKRPTVEVLDEYDVQDLLHAVLKLHFRDIREEENGPSYAGTSSRMDFLLKDEQIVIEVKKTRDGLTDKQVGQQLILDIAYYANHPNCKKLICFVYDPQGRIKNPRGLEKDIERASTDLMEVKLYIRP
jgi:hypothetical protein